MNTPLVTVVIIVFNDVDRISIAIKSALRQSLRPIEIIVVDHGSTDGTNDVIRSYVELDRRVRLIQLPDNDGEPGRPLNAGIDNASGQWVTVMGSDDELEPDACRHMLSFAELKQADVVLGRVARVHTDRNDKITYWHSRLFRNEVTLSSIEDAPEYLYDTISAGKLYRKEFLDNKNIRFPEDILYEDQLFTLQVYHQARRLQIIPETVYRWYSRPQAAKKSITNSRNAIKNFEDRIEVNRRLDKYLDHANSPILQQYKSEKFISHDLNIYLNNLEEQEDKEYRGKFGELSKEYLSAIDLKDNLNIHPMLRVIVGLLKTGDVEGAVAAHQFRQGRGPQPVELHAEGGRQYWLPVDEIHRRGLSGEWFDVTSLGIHLMPFSQRRLAISSSSITLSRSVVSFDLIVGDKGRSLASGVDSIELVLRRRRDAFESTFQLECATHSDTQLRVTGSVDLFDSFDTVLNFHEKWDLWLKINHQGVSKLLRVPVPPGFKSGDSIDLNGRQRLSGNQLKTFATAKNNFSLRVEQSKRVANALAWRIAKGKRRFTNVKSRMLKPVASIQSSPLGRGVSKTSRNFVSGVSVKLAIRSDEVLFESYRGRQYADSPKAISEYLHQSRPDLKQYWTYRYERVLNELPEYVHPVKYGSFEHYLVAARAGYWVDNFGFEPNLKKHPENIYLQTWHGVPLKRLFFDAPRVIAADSAEKRQYANDVSRWDYLISQGRYFEDTFVRSANSNAELIRSGSPRNDLLFGLCREDKDLIKQRLGLPLNRKIVLYMPTYRDEADRSPKYTNPDFALLAEQLQEDWFLLTRQHYYRRGTRIPRDLRAFVKDVSRYPSVEELMVIADVMVTDFSSAMFDYSLLGRPMIFHVPDLEDYETVAPRTYVSLESIAPGPICFTDEDLIEAIRSLESVYENNVARVSDFRSQFVPLEDGQSAARVVDHVWGKR